MFTGRNRRAMGQQEDSTTDHWDERSVTHDIDVQHRDLGFVRSQEEECVVSLEPGGLHAMAGPTTSELRSGDELTVTVEFERADDISVRVMVRSFGDIAAMPAVSDRSPS